MVFQTENLAEKYIVFLFRLKQRPLVKRLLDTVFSSETIQFVETECRTLSKQIGSLLLLQFWNGRCIGNSVWASIRNFDLSL